MVYIDIIGRENEQADYTKTGIVATNTVLWDCVFPLWQTLVQGNAGINSRLTFFITLSG